MPSPAAGSARSAGGGWQNGSGFGIGVDTGFLWLVDQAVGGLGGKSAGHLSATCQRRRVPRRAPTVPALCCGVPASAYLSLGSCPQKP